VTHTHMGMGMGVNSYPPVYMGDPVGLFLCRGYRYGVVIPGGYLPIAISIHMVLLLYIFRPHIGMIVPLSSDNDVASNKFAYSGAPQFQ
jgi:hypothetical protein